MISDRTQSRLDRASEGLPTEEELRDADESLKELVGDDLIKAEALGLDERDIPKKDTGWDREPTEDEMFNN